MNTLYQEIILDHYHHPRNKGKIPSPTKSTTLYNPFCGDKIKIDILTKKGVIKDIKFSGEGCIISQATASLLTEYIKNKKVGFLKKNLQESIIDKLLKINLSPTRRKCALLPLRAIKKLL